MTDESVFGLEKEDATPDLDAIFADDEPESTGPATTEEPAAEEPEPTEEPAAEATTEPAAEVEGATEEASETDETPVPETPEEETPTEEEVLYAGRYKEVPQLEEGYKQAQAAFTRASQKAAEKEREADERSQELSALRSALERARPLIERAQQLEQENGEYETDADPNQLREQLRQEIRGEFEQQQTAAEQKAEYEAAQNAIAQFRTAHPDTEGTDVPLTMRALFEEYQAEDPKFGPTSLDNLEIIHSLASDPRVKGMLDTFELFPEPEYVEIAKELVATPELVPIVQAHANNIDNPGFMEWARQQVRPSTPTTPDPQKTQEAAQQRRAAAHVVKGGSGAPADAAPGTRPGDLGWLFDSPEQQKQYREDGESSPLFQ